MATLAVDVGNTNIVLGVLTGDKVTDVWRISTVANRTSDEYHILFENLFQAHGVNLDDIDDAVLSSVVPPAERELVRYFERRKIAPLVIGPGIKTGMRILYDNPREVGADRIVNAVAAYQRLQRGAIIVDFGTATTWDVINDDGDYLGGVIAPGIGISSEALFQRASKLPRVDLKAPPKMLGRDTVGAMQAGLVFGYAGMVDEIVRRLRTELGEVLPAVATGGSGRAIIEHSQEVSDFWSELTLEGLALIYKLNR